jgi:hypothetical protein
MFTYCVSNWKGQRLKHRANGRSWFPLIPENDLQILFFLCPTDLFFMLQVIKGGT